MGWWSFVGCDSFGDETYGDVKTLGDNIWEVLYVDETYGDATYGDIWSLYPLQVSFYEDAVGFTLLRCFTIPWMSG
jgi:hypothetical protein